MTDSAPDTAPPATRESAATAKNGEATAQVDVDFDQLESLAAELTQVIHERAATWETQFDAGPGQVVSVSDAAWVIAKHLLTDGAARRVGVQEQT